MEDLDRSYSAQPNIISLATPASSAGITDGVNGNIVGNGGANIDITTVLDTTMANNGGPTLTHALVPGSPAIDAGDNTLIPLNYADQDGIGAAELSPDDQRGTGFPSILDATVDMGALESPSAAPVPGVIQLVTSPGYPVTISESQLVAAAKSPSHRTLTVASVDLTAQYGLVSVKGLPWNRITYTPEVRFGGQPDFYSTP